jgi:S1-C subfamily serine protease
MTEYGDSPWAPPRPSETTPWGDAVTEPLPTGPSSTITAGDPPTAPIPVQGGMFGVPRDADAGGPPPGGSWSGSDTGGSSGSGGGTRQGRGWLAVAIVAALIGGGVGAGVTALADHNNSNPTSVTIKEASSAPGAAVLSGNVSIPKLVQEVLPAVVSIDVKTPQEEDEGTGMIISSDGMVVTNNHVIALAEEGGTITVTQSGQTKAEAATLVGTDTTQDVALLKINNVSGLPTITFGDSDKAVVGDAVVAIGNALGLQAGTPTVTQGIVSALGRTVTAGSDSSSASETLNNLIQTDAAINPGNSGGPLIDTAGQVIGMNTAVAGTTSDGSDAQDIGFAIPAKTIESLIPALEKGGGVTTGGGAIGVTVTDLTQALRQQYGFTPQSGALILSVLPGSPAASTGLQEGDVIVGLNGTNITSADDLTSAISKTHAGQQIQLSFYVGDEKQTKSVTLESQAAEQQQEQEAQSGSANTLSPFGGGGFGGGAGGSGQSPFGG